MALEIESFAEDFDPRFKIFHELMARKIRDILLVSTPYDAWILEEDCRLSERIINEYRGLNLSNPPRFTWVSTAQEALAALDKKKFDMVISMSQLADMDVFALGQEIKKKAPELPVVLLAHDSLPPATQECLLDSSRPSGIDQSFVWSGNTDILVALVKSAEDRLNVEHDTEFAGIRVILFVEDSPIYISSLLPVLYRELVSQTQAIMEYQHHEEHKLLTMRARPKILVDSGFGLPTTPSLFKSFASLRSSHHHNNSLCSINFHSVGRNINTKPTIAPQRIASGHQSAPLVCAFKTRMKVHSAPAIMPKITPQAAAWNESGNGATIFSCFGCACGCACGCGCACASAPP